VVQDQLVLLDQLVETVLMVRKEQQELLVVQVLQDRRELRGLQDLQVVMVLTGLKVKKVR